METIRPYQPKDRDNIRKICLINAGNPKTKRDQDFILDTYCDYYIECEPENCFVAANEKDEAIGYIYCAENYAKYQARFNEKYLPKVKELGYFKWKASLGSYRLHAKYAAQYPAHLHIDLLDEYQRKGLGSKLVNVLSEHLKAKGIAGLMLTVGRTNELGINFYKKYGFSELEKGLGDVAMGIKL
ncbi:MAG: GNAT family N-acetyltransferase [Eubacteriales bacterium]